MKGIKKKEASAHNKPIKTISGKLMKILIPLIGVLIVFMIVFLSMQARGII
ncbi:hypothetical protein QYZ88_012565 [Lachnospiraceae bacterium C1.1]|nr:hypothetical protein [Lachnospiraceae bacterium C1.1]